jgi:hypothetical protein
MPTFGGVVGGAAPSGVLDGIADPESGAGTETPFASTSRNRVVRAESSRPVRLHDATAASAPRATSLAGSSTRLAVCPTERR